MATTSTMTYKGYSARVDYDPDDRAFTGRVLDLRDVIHFEGETVSDLETAFRDSVDEYLASCEEDGVEPDRPYSGRVNLRMDPDLHRQASVLAAAVGMSLNDLLVGSVARAVQREQVAEAGGLAGFLAQAEGFDDSAPTR